MDAVNSAWFAGPKAENADWFADLIERVLWDYYFWRRNYFPEDGAVVTSADRRQQDDFRDRFEDLLNELLGRLKADCPFHSPRYAGHMLAEQTLPSIAGYFATMLYNPNNVTTEAAPVNVDLEIEAAGLVSRMLGHARGAWSHLTSGGTMANLEALWAARAVLYLPVLIASVQTYLGSAVTAPRVGASPRQALDAFEALLRSSPAAHVQAAITACPANLAERGWASVEARTALRPAILLPETHHYCFDKAADLLGLGRDALVKVHVDADFRMDVDHLAARLNECERQGRSVAMVVAVVGTTEEGAVDPVHQIVQLREQRARQGKPSFWLHADAAYGGYLCSVMRPERIGLGDSFAEVICEGRATRIDLQLPESTACDALDALGECDSITVDPHKLGYVPYPAGAVSFKDARVKPVLRQSAPYLTDADASFDGDLASNQVGLYALEGSKPGAVAGGVWLGHRAIPLDTTGHGALVRQTIRQACTLHALLERERERPSSVRAVTLCPPGSNIVCYAFVPNGRPGLQTINRLNRALYRRFSLDHVTDRQVYSQRCFVSRTTLFRRQYDPQTVSPLLKRLGVETAEYEAHGVFLLRSVLMNPWYEAARTRGHDHLSGLVDCLYAEASDVWSGQRS